MIGDTRNSRKPNILLIMTDQQRYDQIGYASNGSFYTPNLDRLARQGIIFSHAYSTSTVCVPSRCSLLTGILHHRLPTASGSHEPTAGSFDFLALKEGCWTLPRYLRALGYRTALIGKMHFYPIRARHGFDYMQTCEHLTEHAGYGPGDMDDYHTWLMWNGRADWRGTHMFGPGQEAQQADYAKHGRMQPFYYEAKFHPTNWIAERSIEFLRERSAGEPFFLVCSFLHPHTPYDPPEPYASMFNPDDIQLPQVDFEANTSLPDPFGSEMPAKSQYSEKNCRRALAYIKGLIKQIDDSVGDILQHVDLSNTYVFFTSDHGDYSGHRGLLGKVPWYPFEDLSRVPLFCAGPTVPQDQQVTDLVQNYDFATTCLDLVGAPQPNDVFDATSLRNYFEQRSGDPNRVVYCATTPALVCPMIREGDLKYIRLGDDGPELLFDLANDPAESHSLAEEPRYAEYVTRFRALLSWQLARGVPDFPPSLAV